MRRHIQLLCRYYRVYNDPGEPCVEPNFGFVHKTLDLPLSDMALVLVDVWSTHYIPSWLDRAREVTRTRIAPVLQACRQAGMLVIHAPSPPIADRYGPAPSVAKPALPSPEAIWPPSAFRGIHRAGPYAAFGRTQEAILPEVYKRYETELDIDPLAAPIDGEPVIHTGAQMHELLAERRILHLVYAGFATNWCLIGRDYGILAMNDRGYNVILLRDATMGIEFHDTVETCAATEMAIREIETKQAWSALSEDLVTAASALD